jgi:hypothetical protein
LGGSTKEIRKEYKNMKIRFYWIDPILQIKTKSKLFGRFNFWPCSCGCTTETGWGFNLGVFGFNIII